MGCLHIWGCVSWLETKWPNFRSLGNVYCILNTLLVVMYYVLCSGWNEIKESRTWERTSGIGGKLIWENLVSNLETCTYDCNKLRNNNVSPAILIIMHDSVNIFSPIFCQACLMLCFSCVIDAIILHRVMHYHLGFYIKTWGLYWLFTSFFQGVGWGNNWMIKTNT